MFNKGHEEDRPHRMPCPVQSSFPQGARPWYKEFLQLIGYSNFQRVEEYCEKVWCTDKKRKKLKMSPSKWKYANPQEKKVRSKPEHYRLPRHALDSWGEPFPDCWRIWELWWGGGGRGAADFFALLKETSAVQKGNKNVISYSTYPSDCTKFPNTNSKQLYSLKGFTTCISKMTIAVVLFWAAFPWKLF